MRLFNLFDLVENPHVQKKVRDTILNLGNCFPSGDKEDSLGAALFQLEEICSLAGFSEWEGTEFVDLCRESGGLDTSQASHLILALEKQARLLKRRVG